MKTLKEIGQCLRQNDVFAQLWSNSPHYQRLFVYKVGIGYDKWTAFLVLRPEYGSDKPAIKGAASNRFALVLSLPGASIEAVHVVRKEILADLKLANLRPVSDKKYQLHTDRILYLELQPQKEDA